MAKHNMYDQIFEENNYTEEINGDGGRLARGYSRKYCVSNGDVAAERLGQATAQEPIDDSAESKDAAHLSTIAGLAGGVP